MMRLHSLNRSFNLLTKNPNLKRQGSLRGVTASLIINLRSQEVSEQSQVLDLELYYERLILVKTKPGKGRESGGLVEHVQVSESELKLNWLIDL